MQDNIYKTDYCKHIFYGSVVDCIKDVFTTECHCKCRGEVKPVKHRRILHSPMFLKPLKKPKEKKDHKSKKHKDDSPKKEKKGMFGQFMKGIRKKGTDHHGLGMGGEPGVLHVDQIEIGIDCTSGHCFTSVQPAESSGKKWHKRGTPRDGILKSRKSCAVGPIMKLSTNSLLLRVKSNDSPGGRRDSATMTQDPGEDIFQGQHTDLMSNLCQITANNFSTTPQTGSPNPSLSATSSLKESQERLSSDSSDSTDERFSDSSRSTIKQYDLQIENSISFSKLYKASLKRPYKGFRGKQHKRINHHKHIISSSEDPSKLQYICLSALAPATRKLMEKQYSESEMGHLSHLNIKSKTWAMTQAGSKLILGSENLTPSSSGAVPTKNNQTIPLHKNMPESSDYLLPMNFPEHAKKNEQTDKQSGSGMKRHRWLNDGKHPKFLGLEENFTEVYTSEESGNVILSRGHARTGRYGKKLSEGSSNLERDGFKRTGGEGSRSRQEEDEEFRDYLTKASMLPISYKDLETFFSVAIRFKPDMCLEDYVARFRPQESSSHSGEIAKSNVPSPITFPDEGKKFQLVTINFSEENGLVVKTMAEDKRSTKDMKDYYKSREDPSNCTFLSLSNVKKVVLCGPDCHGKGEVPVTPGSTIRLPPSQAHGQMHEEFPGPSHERLPIEHQIEERISSKIINENYSRENKISRTTLGSDFEVGVPPTKKSTHSSTTDLVPSWSRHSYENGRLSHPHLQPIPEEEVTNSWSRQQDTQTGHQTPRKPKRVVYCTEKCGCRNARLGPAPPHPHSLTRKPSSGKRTTFSDDIQTYHLEATPVPAQLRQPRIYQTHQVRHSNIPGKATGLWRCKCQYQPEKDTNFTVKDGPSKKKSKAEHETKKMYNYSSCPSEHQYEIQNSPRTYKISQEIDPEMKPTKNDRLSVYMIVLPNTRVDQTTRDGRKIVKKYYNDFHKAQGNNFTSNFCPVHCRNAEIPGVYSSEHSRATDTSKLRCYRLNCHTINSHLEENKTKTFRMSSEKWGSNRARTSYDGACSHRKKFIQTEEPDCMGHHKIYRGQIIGGLGAHLNGNYPQDRKSRQTGCHNGREIYQNNMCRKYMRKLSNINPLNNKDGKRRLIQKGQNTTTELDLIETTEMPQYCFLHRKDLNSMSTINEDTVSSDSRISNFEKRSFLKKTLSKDGKTKEHKKKHFVPDVNEKYNTRNASYSFCTNVSRTSNEDSTNKSYETHQRSTACFFENGSTSSIREGQKVIKFSGSLVFEEGLPSDTPSYSLSSQIIRHTLSQVLENYSRIKENKGTKNKRINSTKSNAHGSDYLVREFISTSLPDVRKETNKNKGGSPIKVHFMGFSEKIKEIPTNDSVSVSENHRITKTSDRRLASRKQSGMNKSQRSSPTTKDMLRTTVAFNTDDKYFGEEDFLTEVSSDEDYSHGLQGKINRRKITRRQKQNYNEFPDKIFLSSSSELIELNNIPENRLVSNLTNVRRHQYEHEMLKDSDSPFNDSLPSESTILTQSTDSSDD